MYSTPLQALTNTLRGCGASFAYSNILSFVDILQDVFPHLLLDMLALNTAVLEAQQYAILSQFLHMADLLNKSKPGKEVFKKKIKDLIVAVRAVIIV